MSGELMFPNALQAIEMSETQPRSSVGAGDETIRPEPGRDKRYNYQDV